MSQPIEKFVNLLLEAELITRSQLAQMREHLAGAGHTLSDEELANWLADSGHLTDFQANEVRNGTFDRLVVGDYVILNPMGRGGMGQVFRARHSMMKREVAVKFTLTDPDGTIDQSMIERFEREVQAASKLLHPNIVSSLDAGRHGGICYLVMEYVRGMNLSSYIREHGPMSFRKALDCTLQVAQGLEYAHSQGVVHRDIKPGNLLMTSDGQVKILDMGLVRMDAYHDQADGAMATEDPLTREGQLLGTVDFMAPEQAVDPHSCDARADIYGLGCTLYFLMLGSPPFRRHGGSAMSKIIAHREAPIPSLSQLRADVPTSFDRVFQKMMAKQVSKRYQTVSELILDLRKVQSQLGTMIDSITETKTMRRGRSAGPWRGVAIAGGVIAALLMVGAIALYANRDRFGASGGPVTAKSDSGDKSGSSSKAVLPIPTGPVDLLERSDLTANVIVGQDFRLANGALHVPEGVPSKLRIPIAFPRRFHLDLQVARASGTGPLVIGMSEEGRSFYLLLDRRRKGNNGDVRLSALGTKKDGRLVSTLENVLLLEPHQPVDLSVVVTENSLTLNSDERAVITWEGDFRELMLGGGWGMGNAAGLLIGSNEKASFEITRLRFVPDDSAESRK